MPVLETAIAIKLILALKGLLLAGKAWLAHGLTAGIAFILFAAKGIFVHLLLLFATAGWLAFSGADPSWQAWLTLSVRLLSPLSLLAFAGALIWNMGIWLTGGGWIRGSLPLWGLTIALTAPTFFLLPLLIEVVVYLLVLTIFWSILFQSVPRLFAQWRTEQKQTSRPTPTLAI